MPMPIYEYSCSACDLTFSHLWRSMQAASTAPAPPCPDCASPETRRIMSPAAVLGGVGGLTPGEQAAHAAGQARQASVTPKEQIDSLRAAKPPKSDQ
jgi:putative FmdB family regulatory protein